MTEALAKEVSGVPKGQLIELVSKELESNPSIKAPDWVFQTKSGQHATRPIEDLRFWPKRLASLLLAVMHEPAGVSSLRTKYGGRRKHSVSRTHHKPAGGKIIRLGFQQLELAGFVKKDKKGRMITPKGESLVSKVASSVQ